ncbi:MAG: T9SS type A sorting domain-containing protein [Bacteroidota bacterium]
MKKLYTTLAMAAIMIGSMTFANAQALGGFKITYDATTGCTGLPGAPSVYCHSGAGTAAGTAWSYVVGNWGQDDGIGQMTMDGVDIWALTFNDPIAYYSQAGNGPIPGGESIFRVGMVFRSADGTLEGKADSCVDIFVDFNEDGSITSSFVGVFVEYNAGVGINKIENVATISNFPNPATTETIFVYDLKTTSNVALRVLNAMGQEIALVASGTQSPSLYKYAYNTADLTNGVYFYQLNVNGKTVTKSFVVNK